MADLIPKDTDEEMTRYDEADMVRRARIPMEGNAALKFEADPVTGRENAYFPLSSGGYVKIGDRTVTPAQAANTDALAVASKLQNEQGVAISDIIGGAGGPTMDDYLAAGFTEDQVRTYEAAKKAAQLRAPGAQIPVKMTPEQTQMGVETPGAALVMPRDMTMRERATAFASGTGQSEASQFLGQIYEAIGLDQFQARQLAEAVLGNPNATRDWGIGIADLTPAGMVFGTQEGYNTFQRGLQAGDPTTAGLGALEAGLSILEAAPLAGAGIKAAITPAMRQAIGALRADVTGAGRAIMQGDREMLGEVFQRGGEPRSLGAAAPDPETASAIIAFHGSPYDFDAFDISKIGTGEGAQVYGPGLYFAEAENVAREYRDALSRNLQSFDDPPRFKAFGDQEAKFIAPDEAQAIVNQGETAIRRRMKRIDDEVARLREQSDTDPGIAEIIDGMILSYDGELQELNTLLRDGFESNRPPKGRLYEVRIRANPEEFLNWDTPISQQSEKVRETLIPFVEQRIAQMGEAGKRFTLEQWMDRLRGGDVMLLDKVGDTPVSRAMIEAGIPGVRYLDQGSRATADGEILSIQPSGDGFVAKVRVNNRTGVGFQSPTTMVTTSRPFATEAEAMDWAQRKVAGGTRNYVVFDDQLIDIVRKYGVAGLAVGAAIQSELGVNEQIEENI